MTIARILSLVGLAALFPATSRASDDVPVDLTWQAPAGHRCPDGNGVLRGVRSFVGPIRGKPREAVSATAEVSEVPVGRFRLTLVTRVGSVRSERVLEDRSCRAVADGAVVILAWLVDPEAMSAQSGLPPADTAGGDDAPLPSPAPEAPSRPAVPQQLDSAAPSGEPPTSSREPSRVSLAIDAGPVADLGTLPGFAAGGQLVASLSVGRLRFAASAAFWPSRSTTLPMLEDGTTPGGTFSLFAGGLDACVLPVRGTGVSLPVTFALCAGGETDWMRGEGTGVRTPSHAARVWGAARATASLELGLSRTWFTAVSATSLLPFERPLFALEAVGDVHRPAALSGRGMLALGVRF